MVDNKNKELKIYDYLGCPYPDGVMSSDIFLYFDKEDIEEVIFNGYSNDDDKDYKEKYIKVRAFYEESPKQNVENLEEGPQSITETLDVETL